ncbi:DUF4013 domain-containing protein [Methanocaldococcus sp.]
MIKEILVDSFNYIKNNFKTLSIGAIIYGIIGAIWGVLEGFIYYYSHHNADLMSLTLIVLFIIIFLITIFIGFIVAGYYVRVMRVTVNNSNKAPDWDDIGGLFVDGLLLTFGIITLFIIFLIVPILFFVLGAITLVFGIGIIFIILGLIFLIVALILSYLYNPLAQVNFAVKGFKGFFEFKRIFSLMKSLDYILLMIALFIISIGVGIVITIITFPITLITIIAKNLYIYILLYSLVYLIQFFISYYLSIFIIRAVSLYYRERS